MRLVAGGGLAATAVLFTLSGALPGALNPAFALDIPLDEPSSCVETPGRENMPWPSFLGVPGGVIVGDVVAPVTWPSGNTGEETGGETGDGSEESGDTGETGGAGETSGSGTETPGETAGPLPDGDENAGAGLEGEEPSQPADSDVSTGGDNGAGEAPLAGNQPPAGNPALDTAPDPGIGSGQPIEYVRPMAAELPITESVEIPRPYVFPLLRQSDALPTGITGPAGSELVAVFRSRPGDTLTCFDVIVPSSPKPLPVDNRQMSDSTLSFGLPQEVRGEFAVLARGTSGNWYLYNTLTDAVFQPTTPRQLLHAPAPDISDSHVIVLPTEEVPAVVPGQGGGSSSSQPAPGPGAPTTGAPTGQTPPASPPDAGQGLQPGVAGGGQNSPVVGSGGAEGRNRNGGAGTQPQASEPEAPAAVANPRLPRILHPTFPRLPLPGLPPVLGDQDQPDPRTGQRRGQKASTPARPNVTLPQASSLPVVRQPKPEATLPTLTVETGQLTSNDRALPDYAAMLLGAAIISVGIGFTALTRKRR